MADTSQRFSAVTIPGLPQKRRQIYCDFSKVHRFRDKITHERLPDVQIQYYLTLYTQPRWRRLISNLYKFYYMHIEKVPSFLFVDSLRDKYGSWRESANNREDEDFFYVPCGARRAYRAHFLSQRGRTTLVTIELSHADYVASRGGK